MKSIFLILPLVSLLAVAAAHADDTFTVLPQQVVSVGDGAGDTFLLESISRNDNSVVVLLRPKGENCNFRFVLDVGSAHPRASLRAARHQERGLRPAGHLGPIR